MMKQDRFLITILAAVVVLILTAVVLFFLRQGSQSYGPDDTPEGVVRNYLVAIHTEDYEKAYSYLQDSDEKPEYQAFIQFIFGEEQQISRTSVRINNTNIKGENAVVKLVLTHSGRGPFDGSWTTEGNALLVQQDGAWKLVNLPYPYLGVDWGGEFYR